MAYDFPDFLPTRQPFNEAIRYFSQVVTSNTTIGSVDLTQFSEVMISANNSDANAIMELQIGWLGGLLDPTPDPVKSVVVGASQFANFRVPTLRQGMQIIVVPHGPVATQGLQVGIYGMNGHTNMYDLYMGKHTLFSGSFGLAANGNTTQFVGPWYNGPVTVSALADNAANAQVVFDYYDGGNASYLEFAQFGMPGQYLNQPQQIFFPPNPVRIRMFNGATAQSVELYVAASGLNGI